MRQFLRRPNCSRFSRIKCAIKRRLAANGVATTRGSRRQRALAENDLMPRRTRVMRCVQAASLNRSMQGLHALSASTRTTRWAYEQVI